MGESPRRQSIHTIGGSSYPVDSSARVKSPAYSPARACDSSATQGN